MKPRNPTVRVKRSRRGYQISIKEYVAGSKATHERTMPWYPKETIAVVVRKCIAALSRIEFNSLLVESIPSCMYKEDVAQGKLEEALYLAIAGLECVSTTSKYSQYTVDALQQIEDVLGAHTFERIRSNI
jgi:hypothetical protein